MKLYRKTSHTVFDCKYHLVWTTKYHKPVLTGRIGSTRPNIAMGWELDAITMVILGGVAIEGGRGSIVGTVLAVLLLGLFTFGMGMANVTGIVMSMVIGILLIVSMVLPQLLKRRGAHA